MNIINEDLARRSKENMSFSDYKPGSATSEYNELIAVATAKIERAKERVSDEGKERLDTLLRRYASNYASWINRQNKNGSGHVSVMLAGPSNYNMRAHEKYMSKEGKLWAEYDELKDYIEHGIYSIINGDRIIKSNDVNALDKLKAKVAKLEEMQNLMKSANKIVKNKKFTDDVKIELLVEMGISEAKAASLLQPSHCCAYGFASYELTNNNATIRNTKQRIAHLERLATQESKEIIIETESTGTEGIRIVDNVAACRLQIFFNGKPSAETRTKLKKNGFRWTPSISAWQSYRSDHANTAAQEIVKAM